MQHPGLHSNSTKWHNLDKGAVLEILQSSEKGLSTDIAHRRIVQYGYNELAEKKKKPAWKLFVSQFQGIMILILIAAAAIAGIMGEWLNMTIICTITIINAIVGFAQEYRASKAIEALKKTGALWSQVMRNGHAANIPSRELVPGDIVFLDAGVLVPADLRLIDVHQLRVTEASLTGESIPIDKTGDTLSSDPPSASDRINMAYKGTVILSGRGTGIVIATGMQTAIGQIARLLQDEKEADTPLQLRMMIFGRRLSLIIVILCIILLITGLLRGESFMNMLLVVISLAVAAVPEALPALITISLAIGAGHMVKKQALIRKLSAVEILGAVTFICTDKTGTLTQNRMKVMNVLSLSEQAIFGRDISLIDALMAFNHDVRTTNEGKSLGDPMEIALLHSAMLHFTPEDFKAFTGKYPRVAEIPFDTHRKCMTTIHRFNEKFLVITKGAAESVSCMMTSGNKASILHQTNQLAQEGMRVLLYGYRIIDKLPIHERLSEAEQNLIPAGITALMDPPREEIRDAIRECREAGIRIVMITGDHMETATAIARKTGIFEQGDIAVTGAWLQDLTMEELDNIVEKIKVYARVSPEQKLTIIQALQRKKQFVAMTGDGVNDAPSLKAANIGIAMGITGTDVSKESAHMILLDDNFSTIVKAIEEGRRIYDNIRRFIKYILSCNCAEILTIVTAPLLGLPLPLLPVHILWINFITDGLPGLALSFEKAEKNCMKRPPRATNESLFSDGIGYHIIWVSVMMASITIVIQAWALAHGVAHWQTMVFTVLSFAQLAQAWSIRSEHEFIYRKGIFTNMPLLIVTLFTCLLQGIVIYWPVANRLLSTQPLTPAELSICIAGAAVIFHLVEIEKWIRASFAKRRTSSLQ